MRRAWLWRYVTAAIVVVMGLPTTVVAETAEEIRLVYGSFSVEANARRFAAELAAEFSFAPQIQETRQETVKAAKGLSGTAVRTYRVVSPIGSVDTIDGWRAEARAAGMSTWRLITKPQPQVQSQPQSQVQSQLLASSPQEQETQAPGDDEPNRELSVATAGPALRTPSTETLPSSESSPRFLENFNFDLDFGLQNRLFARRGSNNPDQAQQSASAQLSTSTELAQGRYLLALDLFGRWDSDDAQRSHTDVREFSVTHIADRWQVQAGVGQVFWGVVEFNHLIDVVNQTDLVENPDGEDKLGQPMVTFTALPDWGSVELFILPGFRKRTLPGIDGRLTLALPIDRGASEFESGAEENRVDGLLRISTAFAGVLFDVYHFNGTRRTPRFEVRSRTPETGDNLFLVPNYDTVKQTALAAQANSGDTAFKLEALQQDGGPESYWAAAFGVEHTFVGVLGSAADLGAVVEYHYDSRDGDAFDSFFESDLALGARLAVNDINDSQALLGVVWDTRSGEWVVQLEGSRRLNDHWSLALETRWFMGGQALGRDASIADLLDTKNKLGAVQRDDYLQLEFTRFF